MTDADTNVTLTAQEEKMAEIVNKVLKGETLLRAEVGLEETDMDALYAVAYNVYQSGKYADASKIFGLLSVLDPLDYRFMFGGGSCMQMQGEYLMAGMYYQLAAGLDETNPSPMLHSAECFLALKDRDGAKAALQQALARAGDRKEYAQLKLRAEVMLENLAG